MDIQYNLSASDVLRILGYAQSEGKAALEKFEQEHRVKLPPCLFEFLSIAMHSDLLSTSDIWINSKLHFFYEEIEEWITDEKEFWEQDPESCKNDEYYQFSQIPKEKWPDYVPDYLLIGSDYGAGVATFGICTEDLGTEDPPIYIHHEENCLTKWERIYEKASDFLMAVTCDVLSGANYDTAEEVLQKAGFYYDSAKIQELLSDEIIDLSKAHIISSIYFEKITCCFDKEEKKLLILFGKEDFQRICIISK